MSNTANRQIYPDTPSLNSILIHGIQYNNSRTIRHKSEIFIRNLFQFLHPPTNSRNRLYYLSALVRIQKQISGFDPSEPWEYLWDLIENIHDEENKYKSGHVATLNLIVNLLEYDFSLWYKNELRNNGNNYRLDPKNAPMVVRIFWLGNSPISINEKTKKIFHYYFTSFQNEDVILTPLRKIISIVAQVFCYKEIKEGSNGVKLGVASYISQEFIRIANSSVSFYDYYWVLLCLLGFVPGPEI